MCVIFSLGTLFSLHVLHSRYKYHRKTDPLKRYNTVTSLRFCVSKSKRTTSYISDLNPDVFHVFKYPIPWSNPLRHGTCEVLEILSWELINRFFIRSVRISLLGAPVLFDDRLNSTFSEMSNRRRSFTTSKLVGLSSWNDVWRLHYRVFLVRNFIPDAIRFSLAIRCGRCCFEFLF